MNCQHLDYDDYFDRCRDCGFAPVTTMSGEGAGLYEAIREQRPELDTPDLLPFIYGVAILDGVDEIGASQVSEGAIYVKGSFEPGTPAHERYQEVLEAIR